MDKIIISINAECYTDKNEETQSLIKTYLFYQEDEPLDNIIQRFTDDIIPELMMNAYDYLHSINKDYNTFYIILNIADLILTITYNQNEKLEKIIPPITNIISKIITNKYKKIKYLDIYYNRFGIVTNIGSLHDYIKDIKY